MKWGDYLGPPKEGLRKWSGFSQGEREVGESEKEVRMEGEVG